MGCTTRIKTADCFYNNWKMCRGVYWSLNGGQDGQYADVVMSRTGGNCPSSGITKRFYQNNPDTIGEFTVNVFHAYDKEADIEIWKTSELSEPDPEFGFGKAEITHTDIGPGLIFDVGSKIDYSLRVMNTGSHGKIYSAVGLGYHDKNGNVFFTGKYVKQADEISGGKTITWTGHIEVLHKDYAAREMTSRGAAVYFMSGHDKNGKIIWDRSEYLPVELILESEYVDPTDPKGVPDDWEPPVYDDTSPWDDFWNITTPEPEPEPEPPDLMPFIYIGFVGLVGYLLIKGR